MGKHEHQFGVPLEGIIDWCAKSVHIRSKLDDTSINSDGAKAIILPQNHPMYFLCSKYGVDHLTSFFMDNYEREVRDCVGQQYLFGGGYDGEETRYSG